MGGGKGETGGVRRLVIWRLGPPRCRVAKAQRLRCQPALPTVRIWHRPVMMPWYPIDSLYLSNRITFNGSHPCANLA